jgi:DNA-binding MarR family transcriptional regulator
MYTSEVTDKTPVAGGSARSRISDDALETGKLLVEFLHATYATRRQRLEGENEPGAGPEEARIEARPEVEAASSAGQPASAASAAGQPPMSAHAVRAAIHVYQHGERTIGQIASGLGISYGWASRVVEELEAAGHAVRERDEQDRRIVHVRLDPAALAEVERAYAWRGEAVDRALEPFSESERATIRLFLRRVIDQLRESEPQDR